MIVKVRVKVLAHADEPRNRPRRPVQPQEQVAKGRLARLLQGLQRVVTGTADVGVGRAQKSGLID